MQLSNFKTNFNLKNFIEAGIMIDTETSKPSYNDYIYGIRLKHTVYDLRKSSLNLRKAMEYINTLCSKTISSGSIGFITVSENTPLLKTTSLLAKKSFQQGYTSYKWLGGFLSNWKTVVKKHIALERRYKKNRSLLAQIEKNICISKKKSSLQTKRKKYNLLSFPINAFIGNINKELSKCVYINTSLLKKIFENQYKLLKKEMKRISSLHKVSVTNTLFSSKKIISLKKNLNATCSSLVVYNDKFLYKNKKCLKLVLTYLDKHLKQLKLDLPDLLKNEKYNSRRFKKNFV